MTIEQQPPAHYSENMGRSGTLQRSPMKLKSKPVAAKPVAKGHEAFLKAIETTGAEITIELLDEPNPIVGTIKHSDKFTISVKCTRPDGSFQVYVVFKHAIRLFWTTPKKDEVTASEQVH